MRTENRLPAHRRIHQRMPVVAVVAVFFSALAGWTEWKAVAIAVPFAWWIGLIAYGYFVSRTASGDAETLNQLGEHYYFVGYISTITGLGCVLGRLGMQPGLIETPAELLPLAGVSVLCTIVGLIGMNSLRAKAFELERQARAKDAERDANRTRDFIAQIAQNFDSFQARMEKLESTRMEEFSRLMNASELSQILMQLIGNIQQGAAGLNRLQEVSSQATQTVHQLGLEWGSMGRKLVDMNKRIGKMLRDAEKVQINWEQIAGHSDRIEMLVGHLDRAAASMKTLGEHAQAAKEQFKPLGEAAATAQRNTQNWNEQTIKMRREIDDTCTAFSNLCHKLETTAKKELGDFCAEFQNAFHKLRNSMTSARDFVERLEESTGKVAVFSESLDGMVGKTAQHSQTFDAFKANLEQTAATLREQFQKLSGAVDSACRETQIWREQTDGASREMRGFGETFRNTCGQLQQASKTVDGFADRLQEQLSSPNWNSKMAGKFIDDFASRVDKSLAEVAGLSESLRAMTKGAMRSREELNTLNAKLNETTGALQSLAETPGFWRRVKKHFSVGK